MAAAGKRKIRILYVLQILAEYTDDRRGLTMPQIISHLADKGVTAERKALYGDFAALEEYGIHVGKIAAAPVQYTLADRRFSLQEVMLLVDAVQSSKFLSDTQSDNLVRQVRKLASGRQREALNKQVHVHGRPRRQDESDFRVVDCIQEAIARKCKICFHYIGYGAMAKKEERHDGREYLQTPVCVVYSDGYYYLVAYSDNHESFPTYRIDRMTRVLISDEPATRNTAISNFDVDELGSCAFGMYGGARQSVTLSVAPSAMNVVVDRFGKDIICAEGTDGRTSVTAAVMVSPVFFGWLTQMGTDIRIQKPRKLAEEYTAYLSSIVDFNTQTNA